MLQRFRRPFRKDFLFFIAIALGWCAVGVYFRGDIPMEPRYLRLWGALLGWSLLSAAGTLVCLYWIDFFQPFKLFKFFPDFFSLLFVCPLMGLVAKPLAIILFGSGFLRSREILIGSVVTAIVGALLESLELWYTAHNPVKSTVYLALTSGQKERFNDSLRSVGWERYFQFLTQDEFNGALVTGGRLDYVIISRTATKDFLLHQNILRAHMLGVAVLDYHTVLSHMRGHVNVNDTDIWTFLAGSLRQGKVSNLYREVKFYLEPVAAAVLLVILLPLFAVLAILIKFTSRGPVFFTQRRTGMLGAEFDLIKFRTMRTDAETGGPKWASENDQRITTVGKFLRKSRLDELPQLWNVVRGEISFMGPRPERPEFYRIIGQEVPYFSLRLLVRPGITGWAQLLGGYAASIEESQRKLEYDLYYMRYLSPRLDLIIFGRTILTLLRGSSGR